MHWSMLPVRSDQSSQVVSMAHGEEREPPRPLSQHLEGRVRIQKHTKSLATHSYHVPGLSMVCQT